MNDTLLHTSQSSPNSLNVYELYRSETMGNMYRQVLETGKGPLSVSYGNDLESKFQAAIAHSGVSVQQQILLERIGRALIEINTLVNPPKLQISIYHDGSDNEIYVVRDHHADGVAKLILNEDGLLAMSFIGKKGANRSHLMESFYDADEPATTVDFPQLMYRFLSL